MGAYHLWGKLPAYCDALPLVMGEFILSFNQRVIFRFGVSFLCLSATFLLTTLFAAEVLTSCGARVNGIAGSGIGASRINIVATTAVEVVAVTYFQWHHVGSTIEGPGLTGDRSGVKVSGAVPVIERVDAEIRV